MSAPFIGISRASCWCKPAPGMSLDLLKHWPSIGGGFLIDDQAADLAVADIAAHYFLGSDLARFVQPARAAGGEIGRRLRAPYLARAKLTIVC
jgi:hypothetical protein